MECLPPRVRLAVDKRNVPFGVNDADPLFCVWLGHQTSLFRSSVWQCRHKPFDGELVG